MLKKTKPYKTFLDFLKIFKILRIFLNLIESMSKFSSIFKLFSKITLTYLHSLLKIIQKFGFNINAPDFIVLIQNYGSLTDKSSMLEIFIY